MATLGSPSQPGRSADSARLALSQLPPEVPLEQVFRRACELSAHALTVERVGVWLFIDHRTILRCANLFERSRHEHSSGTLLRVADYPTYFSSLTIFKAVPAEVATSDAWTAELAASYLRPLGITSMLDVGLFVDDNLVGVICHEHVGPPREWTDDDRRSAMGVAEVLAARIQAAEVRELRATFQSHSDRPEAQETNQALERLADVVRGFKSLIDGELLQLARPEAGPPAVLDLVQEMGAILPALQASLGPRYPLRLHDAGGSGRVLIDRARFSELVWHLVRSASEAMPDGGPIEVSLSAVKPREEANPASLCVRLDVSDTGRESEEATGARLRLLMARQIVDAVGGAMHIDDVADRGTTVQVVLPRIGAGDRPL
jgi:hypothetical protein